MKPNSRTVSNLFGEKWRYQIPLFQRQYVWSRERQWEPLWEDIQSKASAPPPDRRSPARPHFLGAIVFKPETAYGDEVPTREVIDGQQRLTTLQLVLAAMRDVRAELNINKYSAELETFTRNTGEMARPEVECFKVWPTEGDIEVFSTVMNAGSRQAVEAVYPQTFVRRKPVQRHLIVEAYVFFHDAVRAYVTGDGPDPTERFSSLFRALTQQIQLVSVELEDQDDPQVIFETLNARGEPLLASDLLRNFIFVRADRSGEDYRSLYRTYWLSFDTLKMEGEKKQEFFWKVKERQGRLLRPRLDLFMQHFLSMKRAEGDGAEEPIQIGHLYEEYQDWIKRSKPYPTVEAELADLQRMAGVFKGFFLPDTTTRAGLFAARLKVLDTNTVYPLLLFLATSERVDKASLDGMLVDLESFLVRRLVCGRTTKNYNRLFLTFLKAAAAETQLTRGRLQEILLSGEGDAVDWPSDESFRMAWLHKEAYDLLQPRRVEMILRAVNSALTTDRTEQGIRLGTLFIEHVMPQSWKKNWPAPVAGENEQLSEEELLARRQRAIHSFGNLTLLTAALNSSVSNGPWAEKRPKIIENSALRLNAYFQNQQEWNDAAILTRGERLFATAREVWPIPTESRRAT